MEEQELDKPLRDLIEIVHFTENVSTKIHGLLDEAEIYRTVKEEFAKSKQYSATIFLLTDDGSKLRIVETSMSPGRLKAAEKVTGLRTKEHNFELNKSSILRQVVREGKTFQTSVSDLLSEMFPRPMAYLISKIMGYEKRPFIVTPLIRHGKIMGALAVSSTELAEQFIPSVRNLARHISTALELADEHAVRKKAEETLAHERDLLHALMDNIPDSIYFKDVASRFTRINRAQARILGVEEPKDAIGKTDFDFFTPEHARDAYADEQNIVKSGQPLISKVEKIRRADGQFRWVSATKVPIMDKEGRVTGTVGISRDVTEHKKAEEALKESEERYRSLVELAPDSIMTFDLKGVITSCNTASARLSGYSKDELVGKHFSKVGVLRARDFPKYLKMLPSIIRGKVPKPFEVLWKHKNGTLHFGEVHLSLMKEKGKTIGIQAIMIDITERKKMEEQLKEYTENLEKIVEERTRKLKETQEQLLKAERLAAIGETAAMVGHDLRNPLQVLINTVYLGKETVKSMPSPCMELAEKKGLGELFGTVGGQVEYMNKIVSDLQDYARPLTPQLVETSLHQLINETLSTVTIPETVKVSIEIKEDFPKLMVDPTMMNRVFINLITNAVQAMPDGGQLTIGVSRTEEAAFISVEDTGAGIPEENLDRLFHPLFTTKPKGTGFGLAVCKRLMEAHDGSITVESKVGKGSTFTVKIPLRKEVK